MIRKLASEKYRLYSRKKNPNTGRRRNLGTFNTLAAAKKHEREIQYSKSITEFIFIQKHLAKILNIIYF